MSEKSHESLSPEDDHIDGGMFLRVAVAAGVTAAEWQEIALKLPHDRHGLLNWLLRTAARSGNILLCFGDHVLLQYDGTLSFSWSPLVNPRTKQRIRGKNEVVDPSATLNADNLREICVLLEALVFRCVHLKLENGRTSYKERTEDYEKRIDRLLTANLLTTGEAQLAGELYVTRCHFAHSVKPVSSLPYLSEKLSDRWGSSGTRQAREFNRYFLPDAFRFSEALLANFKPVQIEQIDCDGFKAALFEKLKATG